MEEHRTERVHKIGVAPPVPPRQSRRHVLLGDTALQDVFLAGSLQRRQGQKVASMGEFIVLVEESIRPERQRCRTLLDRPRRRGRGHARLQTGSAGGSVDVNLLVTCSHISCLVICDPPVAVPRTPNVLPHFPGRSPTGPDGTPDVLMDGLRSGCKIVRSWPEYGGRT